jgi:hypothetical protein
MSQIEPHGFVPRDISITLGTAATVLAVANQYRSHLQMQNVSQTFYYSFTNAACAPGATGCYQLGAGQTYMSGAIVPEGNIYVAGTGTGSLLVATEC